ncbi:hypothetical protein CspeluHIS016_0504530 [Cutaneotrichosporon spelunceum]|uniref:Uncharacterized protein n=1 Tax=Cutaneotrichosporon spelunceum TaxID=1672016 RepID=A0AAD3TX01_9TREE|nr:hypothetical protein CspeluHIS016_0504530 [Cutaneotrichosporon spelunceum]
MGNSQTKLANSASPKGAMSALRSPVRRWEGNCTGGSNSSGSYTKDNAATRKGNNQTSGPAPMPTSAHNRSISAMPDSTPSALVPAERSKTNFVRTDRPGPVVHQRAASESVSGLPVPIAKAEPPQRRALGLVRKISFRSRPERATPTARVLAPTRASSADDAELLATKEDDEQTPAPPAKLTISVSDNSALARTASLGHGTQPVRPLRSTRRSAQAAFGTNESPAATPAKASAKEQGPRTPTRATNRALVPRSPTIGPMSPRRASPGSPHRQSMATVRRAEREWKAKLAALTAGPSSPGRLRQSNGPRPPPRRVQRPSASPCLAGSTDGLSGRMAQSLSLSHLSSLEDADVRIPTASCPPPNTLDSIREFSPAIDHPGSAFTAPSTVFTGVSGMTKSASTTTMSRASKRSPGSSVVALSGVPEYERTPLSPIQQEPVSPRPLMTPASQTSRTLPAFHHHNAHHSPAPSLAKSLAPSSKTFGPGPSPTSLPRPLDWTPDDRIIVSRSSVPDLSRVSSPPPVPSLPPGLRLAEKSPPAPVPACASSPMHKQPIVPPRRTESSGRRVHDESKPVVAPVVINATPSHRIAHLCRIGTDSPEPPLPRTTSLQHAREMAESPSARTVEMEDSSSDAISHRLHSAYDLTPGLETGRRPRKTGLPMDDLQRWLAQTAGP